MKLVRSTLLLALGACSSPEPTLPPKAPGVYFTKAAVLAAVDSDNRREVEDIVANEIHLRRPEVELISTWEQFPELAGLTEQRVIEDLQRQRVDLLVTIVPFSEEKRARYDDWSDVASDTLGTYVERLDAQSLRGTAGVQVVAWDVATRAPVYAETTELLVDEIAAPRDVIDFTVGTVTRDR